MRKNVQYSQYYPKAGIFIAYASYSANVGWPISCLNWVDLQQSLSRFHGIAQSSISCRWGIVVDAIRLHTHSR